VSDDELFRAPRVSDSTAIARGMTFPAPKARTKRGYVVDAVQQRNDCSNRFLAYNGGAGASAVWLYGIQRTYACRRFHSCADWDAEVAKTSFQLNFRVTDMV